MTFYPLTENIFYQPEYHRPVRYTLGDYLAQQQYENQLNEHRRQKAIEIIQAEERKRQVERRRQERIAAEIAHREYLARQEAINRARVREQQRAISREQARQKMIREYHQQQEAIG